MRNPLFHNIYSPCQLHQCPVVVGICVEFIDLPVIVQVAETDCFVLAEIEPCDLFLIDIHFSANDLVRVQPGTDPVQQKRGAGRHDHILRLDQIQEAPVQLVCMRLPEAADQIRFVSGICKNIGKKVVYELLDLAFFHQAHLISDQTDQDSRNIQKDPSVVPDHVKGEVNGALAAVERIVKIKNFHGNLHLGLKSVACSQYCS